jgi:methyl-accepting chemotaxis protein
MDFNEAIKAHTFWKVTLRWMINGQRPVDGEKLGRDNDCELGHWIHGDGAAYKSFSSYQTLVSEHAGFHAIAGAVARCIATGDSEVAMQMMADGGEFSLASARTIEAIRRLQGEVESLKG